MPITKSFAGLSMLGLGMMPFGDFESIATVTVGAGGASSIEFTSIPGTYQHLQVRFLLRRDVTGNGAAGYARLGNSTIDTGSNYAWHILYGDGSGTAATGGSSQTSMFAAFTASTTQTASVFAGGVMDIIDYSSSSKNKTIRVHSGYDSNGSGYHGMMSGLWINTSVVDRITLFPVSSNWAQHSTAALYGIKS